jgi:L-ribulose-5-phosphate 4-epimerase
MVHSNETGSIKFQCNWIQTGPIEDVTITKINQWRDILFNNKLIGAYLNGVGYGNISIRLAEKEFLISGTSTGHIENLTTNHYSRVINYNFEENALICKGPIKASAESLTHAAIYEMNQHIQAVIHIHNKQMWNKLLHKIPTTSANVEYGTPQMALEMKRLFDTTDLFEKKILAMGGHEEGIISFGKDLEEAGDLILSYL